MRESKTLEYKSEISNSFLKTVSAFANFGEGLIKFGIANTGEILGIKDPVKACLNIENKINDSIKPKPDFTLEIESNNVISLRVVEGVNKPYFYNSKAYKRNDSATIEVDTLDLSRLILEGQNKTFESVTSKEQNLKFNILEKELKKEFAIEAISKDILISLELYSKKEGYNIAAALVADENSFFGIDIARFGDSFNIILDRETFEHISILKQYDAAMIMYRKYFQYEKIEGALRKKIEKIPEEAFREALANSLVHRTWDLPSHIRISMFENRIEISSPGGLPNGITKEEYLDGQVSILRNPIIGNIFFRLHRIERFGTGIRRIKESYKSSEIKPQFEFYENSIKIILPVLIEKLALTFDEKKVYQSLSKNRKYSRTEIEELVGFGKSKTVMLLNSLRDQGFIETSGNGRGLKYQLL